MPATTSCTPCCVDTQTVNVPGIEGLPGTDGIDGINAYTTTTANFTVPAIGSDVTVFVGESGWMVVGQPIFVEGPATFTVASITNETQVELTFVGAFGDVSPGATITAGAGVTPGGAGATSGSSITSTSAYASGSVYTLTATNALLNFGTTDPSVTLASAGTYVIFGRVRFDFVAWNSTTKTISTNLRSTTTGDVVNAATSFILPDTTAGALSTTAASITLPPVQYTALAGEIVQIWASLDAVASVSGTITAVEASITALKIA